MYVMRAAQSKGVVDLAAFYPFRRLAEGIHVQTSQGVGTRLEEYGPPIPKVWFVQCKRGTGRLAPAEREELITVARAAGAEPILAKTGPKGRGVVFINLNEED